MMIKRLMIKLACLGRKYDYLQIPMIPILGIYFIFNKTYKYCIKPVPRKSSWKRLLAYELILVMLITNINVMRVMAEEIQKETNEVLMNESVNEIELEYSYVYDKDNQHTKHCTNFEEIEDVLEACSYNEDDICELCGNKKEELEKIGEPEYSYEYIGDDSHIKRCLSDESVEDIEEECTYDENDTCTLCGNVKEKADDIEKSNEEEIREYLYESLSDETHLKHCTSDETEADVIEYCEFVSVSQTTHCKSI